MLIKSVVLKKEMKMDLKLAKLILLMPGRETECLEIIQEKKIKQAEIVKVFKVLASKNMGEFEE